MTVLKHSIIYNIIPSPIGTIWLMEVCEMYIACSPKDSKGSSAFTVLDVVPIQNGQR